MAFRTNKTPVLQTKSASGAVATFNTALAMPLSSCNIAVNAWQEGSGDPSPSNVRAIHGFSEVNATRCGKNLFDINSLNTEYTTVINGVASGTAFDFSKVTIPFVLPKTPITISFDVMTDGNEGVSGNGLRLVIRYSDGTPSTSYSILNRTTNWTKRSFTTENAPIKEIAFSYGSIPFNNWYIKNLQFEVGSTATDYEPYVTPTIYPIQLGQEVYGAEVDAVNGVAHCTHSLVEFDGDNSEYWINYTAGNGYYIQIGDMDNVNNAPVISNYLPAYSGINNLGIRLGFNNNYAYMYQVNTIDGVSDVASWMSYLQSNPLTFVYPLATPFDIQLTPTQIETLIGNNTIFADTGDIDLTYKDLDIAKRGNFREVFKLPS